MITDYFHMYNINTFDFLPTPDNSNISYLEVISQAPATSR